MCVRVCVCLLLSPILSNTRPMQLWCSVLVCSHILGSMQVTRMCINTTANLKDLVCELQEVTDWFHLGICLGILLAKLQSIKRDYRHIDERRREVLLAWRDNEKPTWSKLVGALVEMRNMSLAYQIAGKYGNKTVCKLLNVTLEGLSMLQSS